MQNKPYTFKKKYIRDSKEDSVWVEAHDTLDFSADFYEVFDGEEKDQMECIFTLYHTHGPTTAEAVSKKRIPQ